MPEKVREQDRITDTHLDKLITQAGMSKEYVELLNDYAPRSRGKEHTPYARFYRDRLSSRRIAVIGLLPYVSHAGFSIVPKWRILGDKFIAEENCFEAEVENETIRVTCVNDQPTGAKVNDQLIWHPQSYLNNVEQHSGNPVWLDTDLVNTGYHFNTIEWDYGFCKRRVRIIEGRIRERWIFSSNPHGEVRIKHNHTGALRLKKSGVYWINDDEELIPASVFDEATYPFAIMASPETFYPDAHIESASVDGVVGRSATEDWNTIQGHADGNFKEDDQTDTLMVRIEGAASPNYARIYRGFALFDATGIGAGFTVVAPTTLSLYGSAKGGDAFGIAANIYSSAPASSTALANGDYDSLGTTAFCDTPIAYADFSIVAYNDFALNAVGMAAVDLVVGASKFGVRESNFDAPDNPPVHDESNSYIKPYNAEQGGTTKDPKLVVTYEAAAGLEDKSPSMAAKLMSRGML